MTVGSIKVVTCLALAGLTTSFGFAPPAAVAEPDAAGIEFFEKNIRPVLVQHCYGCHSNQAKKLKGGLLLDSRAGTLAGGDTGSAVVPGNVKQSLLIAAIRYGDDSYQMPPKGKLPAAVIADFEKWVRIGAPDPRSGKATSGSASSVAVGKGREFWFFRPAQRHRLPKLKNDAWPRRPIDAFILAKLEANKLAPSPPADRRILIRRATFDVLGLPPTPDEVNDFLADSSPFAYSRLVNRLLSSPHYGERWGRYWLDLARYTDSTATWLQSTGQAWLYRDWVIQAFNNDMPYDQFVKRQLATDLMPETGPEDAAALGFIGLSPTYWKELKLDKDVIKVVVAEEYEERIDSLSRTFLGLTVACARCHEHKFDPIAIEDYYALAGVFASTRLTDRPIIPEPAASVVRKARERVKLLEEQLKKLQAKKPLTKEPAAKIKELQAQIADIKRSTPQYETPWVHAVSEASLFIQADGPDKTKLVYKPGEPRDLRIHIRGNPAKEGPVVRRRFLTALSSGGPSPFRQGSGRLELANAIVDDAASQSARVMVNRVWRHHFGRGLVDTPSDFGTQGSPPSHPKLLDDLSVRFIQNGWSLKWLHREIMLSSTYQQDSSHNAAKLAVDPDNRWLWRMNRRRLDIEAWRDAMLAVSGTLDRTIGGPALDLDSPNNRRRTVYGRINRRELNGMLRLFDFPDPTAHSPKREATTTPLQQLFVLNSPFIQRQSAALLKTTATDSAGGLEGRIREIYPRLFVRPATKTQVRQAIEFLTNGNVQRAVSDVLWKQYVQVLLGSNEFMFID